MLIKLLYLFCIISAILVFIFLYFGYWKIGILCIFFELISFMVAHRMELIKMLEDEHEKKGNWW